MIASRHQGAPSGRSLVHRETTAAGQRASSSGIDDADRSVDPQTAGAADTLAGSAGPSRGARNSGRSRAANDARDSAVAARAYPRLGDVRHDGCPGRQGLRGCRRRDRPRSFHTTSTSPAAQPLRASASPFRPFRTPESLVLVNDLAPRRPQRVELDGQGLFIGRYPRITDFHAGNFALPFRAGP
jgi:hypothetical protein